NDVMNKEYQPPTEDEIEAFKAPIMGSSVLVTTRRSRGRDIAAACGQLATE
ncbi:MAG: 23S rRNA (adenine(2503)-C(2))-methyltransferase RlmN, partial [Fibrobacteres bacterium]|nr:23S rRNA (adenine(2503)-C(2))-methyltransferase RlmN [Fibrobacterota bacterium]